MQAYEPVEKSSYTIAWLFLGRTLFAKYDNTYYVCFHQNSSNLVLKLWPYQLTCVTDINENWAHLIEASGVFQCPFIIMTLANSSVVAQWLFMEIVLKWNCINQPKYLQSETTINVLFILEIVHCSFSFFLFEIWYSCLLKSRRHACQYWTNFWIHKA